MAVYRGVLRWDEADGSVVLMDNDGEGPQVDMSAVWGPLHERRVTVIVQEGNGYRWVVIEAREVAT